MKVHYSIFIVLNLLLLKRLEAQVGVPDPTFNLNGKVITNFGAGNNSQIYALALQPDGKILAAGHVDNINTHDAFAIARYLPNGSLDTSFNSSGKVITSFSTTNTFAMSLAVQADGKIVAGGYTQISSYDFALVRYNANGSLDTTFDGDGQLTADFGFTFDQILSLQIQPDGKILVGGNYLSGQSRTQFILARYNSNGSPDSTFSGNGALTTTSTSMYNTDHLTSMILQPDGKIIAGGWANNTFVSSFFVVRYKPDGTLDSTFNANGKAIYNMVPTGSETMTAMALQPDGKIVTAGVHTNDLLNYGVVVSRLKPDGSFDNTFDSDGKVNYVFNTYNTYNVFDNFRSMLIQSDGKIVLAGVTKSPSGSSDFVLLRLNPNGSLDLGFDSDGMLTNAISPLADGANAVILQPDGKVLLGGFSMRDSASSDFTLLRYLMEIDVGVLDHSIEESDILFYPNPVKESARLSYESKDEEIISIYLSDMNGKCIKTFLNKQLVAPGKHSEELQFPESIETGTYFLIISSKLRVPKNDQVLEGLKG